MLPANTTLYRQRNYVTGGAWPQLASDRVRTGTWVCLIQKFLLFSQNPRMPVEGSCKTQLSLPCSSPDVNVA